MYSVSLVLSFAKLFVRLLLFNQVAESVYGIWKTHILSFLQISLISATTSEDVRSFATDVGSVVESG